MTAVETKGLGPLTLTRLCIHREHFVDRMDDPLRKIQPAGKAMKL